MDLEEVYRAERKRDLKEEFGNCCFYCFKDFTGQLGFLTLHHRDFLGYIETRRRDPFDHTLVRTACPDCHPKVHIAASTIVLGLLKSVPMPIIRDTLIQEVGLDEGLVACVVHDLRSIGISENKLGSVKKSIIFRILLHSVQEQYYFDMDAMLNDAAQTQPDLIRSLP